MNVLIIVKVLIFVTLNNLVDAGKFKNQTNVPENVNCECLGYALLAVQCSWPQKSCDKKSAAFQNYQYWCKNLNDYYDRRRRGETSDTYDRYLSCQSNMSEKELKKIRNGLMPPKISGVVPVGGVGSSLYPFNAPLPTSVNLTSQMTPIKNQGNCGACWAFSSVAICEWWYKNVSPSSVILSEQALINCNTANNGCSSGWPQKALSYLAANGTANSTFNYTGTRNTCNITSYKKYKCPTQNYEWYIPSSVPNGNCTRLIQLLVNGPVVATIYATTSFSQYKSGLYSETNCPTNGTVNHGINVVGYVKEPTTGKDAFIIRNSWGTGWGVNGYMYIDASSSVCSLCSYFWYYN